jgi:hypothetical protein
MQMGLAFTYYSLPTGKYMDNLNKARDLSLSALKILTPIDFPKDHITAQQTLDLVETTLKGVKPR